MKCPSISAAALLANLALAGSFRAGSLSSSSRVARSTVGAARMDTPHPWSGGTPTPPRRFVGEPQPISPLPREVLPSPTREPREVIMIVLRALRAPDEPYEHYGPQVAIAYSAPSNGASQLTPAQFAKYLTEDSYQIFGEWDEIEIEDELELQDGGARAYQEVLVRRQGDASWTHINWQLIKHNGAWMTESVVTY